MQCGFLPVAVGLQGKQALNSAGAGYGRNEDRVGRSRNEDRVGRRQSVEQAAHSQRESVLFIGTQFSILYTFVYSPA